MSICCCNKTDMIRGQNYPYVFGVGRDLSDATTVKVDLVIASMLIKSWDFEVLAISENIIKLPMHRDESVHFPLGAGILRVTYTIANNTIIEDIPINVNKNDELIAGHGIAIHNGVISTTGGGDEDGMEKHLLTMTGTTIYDGDVECTFDYLYDLMLNTPSFVVLVANDRAYHPNIVSQTELVFSSTNETSGMISVSKVRMDTRNRVTVQTAVAEKSANKSDTIDNSAVKYPTNKAVLDYVTNYFNDYVMPKKANQFGTMTVADAYNLGDGLYYFLKPLYNASTDGKSIHGLCSISEHFINCYDYGIYFGDYSSSLGKFATVGSIDGYGSIEHS